MRPPSSPAPEVERVYMPIDWSPLVELVRKRQSFLLTTHVRPDGDGLGSMLALGETLRERGKQVRMVVASFLPDRYAFLDPQKSVQVFEAPDADHRKADVIIV